MIESLREAVVENPGLYVAWGGFLIGLLFGFIVFRTNFCTMGSISDILTFGDYNRFRAWLLAGGVAIAGVALLQAAGVMDAAQSMYLAPNFAWAANIVGGLMFGFGMVFSGGCVSRNLVRAGSGDLRSLVVLLVVGIFAYMTIGGILGPLRVSLFAPGSADLAAYGLETQGADAVLARLSGVSAAAANLIVVLALVAAILFYCFKDARFRHSRRDMIAGFGIGLCVVLGWFLTGLAQDEFSEEVSLISLTYVRPAGDSLEYLMRFTAFGFPGFGVVTTFGAVIGGFLGALSAGRLHLATFADSGDTLRNMFGAALMGTGGVLALGCTVGQAITGFSTLAVGSMLAFVFIVIGGVAGVKTMERLA